MSTEHGRWNRPYGLASGPGYLSAGYRGRDRDKFLLVDAQASQEILFVGLWLRRPGGLTVNQGHPR